jgi:hypothetical protein
VDLVTFSPVLNANIGPQLGVDLGVIQLEKFGSSKAHGPPFIAETLRRALIVDRDAFCHALFGQSVIPHIILSKGA